MYVIEDALQVRSCCCLLEEWSLSVRTCSGSKCPQNMFQGLEVLSKSKMMGSKWHKKEVHLRNNRSQCIDTITQPTKLCTFVSFTSDWRSKERWHGSPMCCWRKLVSSANPKKKYYERVCIRYICSTRTNRRDVTHHAIFILTLHSISQALPLVALSNPDLGTTKDFLHHARGGKMCVTLVACLLQVPDRSCQRSVTLLSSAF